MQGAYRRFRKRAGVVSQVLNIGDLQLFGVENGNAFQFGPYPYLVTDDFQASYNVVRQGLVSVCIGVGVEPDEAVRHGIVYVQPLDGTYQDAVVRGDSKFGYLIAREAALGWRIPVFLYGARDEVVSEQSVVAAYSDFVAVL